MKDTPYEGGYRAIYINERKKVYMAFIKLKQIMAEIKDGTRVLKLKTKTDLEPIHP